MCQSRGTEKTASRTPQGCLGSALLRYCFKNPAQNSQVPHAKSKVTEAGAGRRTTFNHTQGTLCLPSNLVLLATPRDASPLSKWRSPWSEASFLSWEGILSASVMALHPLQQYQSWLVDLGDGSVGRALALEA